MKRSITFITLSLVLGQFVWAQQFRVLQFGQQNGLDHSGDEVLQVSRTVNSLARANRSKTHVALKFVLSQSTVASAVVGIRTLEHIHRLADFDQSPPLRKDEIEILTNSAHVSKYVEHR